MPNCEAIDSLVTPYVDGQLADAERRTVDDHLRACAPCHTRVAAERAVRDLLQTNKQQLRSSCRASDALHARCASAAGNAGLKPRPTDAPRGAPVTERSRVPQGSAVRQGSSVAPGFSPAIRPAPWRSRLAPLAAAASLVGIVGTAFLYQLTHSSSRVMAAELAADHVKCFSVLNPMLRTQEDAAAVESSMLSGFGWQMHLPEQASSVGLELVGSRPCLYGEGKIAHIMYRHRGQPVSLFMLPRTERAAELVQVLGHRAAIWCANNRTFVLVARESPEEVQRMATAVQTSLR